MLPEIPGSLVFQVILDDYGLVFYGPYLEVQHQIIVQFFGSGHRVDVGQLVFYPALAVSAILAALDHAHLRVVSEAYRVLVFFQR